MQIQLQVVRHLCKRFCQYISQASNLRDPCGDTLRCEAAALGESARLCRGVAGVCLHRPRGEGLGK